MQANIDHAHCDCTEKSGLMDCDDFFSRVRRTSASSLNCASSLPDQIAGLAFRLNTNPAQLVACDFCVRKTRLVRCFSTTRLKRNQVVSGTLRTSRSGRLLRSTTISPKPPLCSSMSVVLNACSIGLNLDLFLPQRTHSSRGKFTPAASAEMGSNESVASTRAQKCFCVAWASREVRTE